MSEPTGLFCLPPSSKNIFLVHLYCKYSRNLPLNQVIIVAKKGGRNFLRVLNDEHFASRKNNFTAKINVIILFLFSNFLNIIKNKNVILRRYSYFFKYIHNCIYISYYRYFKNKYQQFKVIIKVTFILKDASRNENYSLRISQFVLIDILIMHFPITSRYRKCLNGI